MANELTKYYKKVVLIGNITTLNEELKGNIKTHKLIKYNKKTTTTRLSSWSIGFVQAFLLLRLRYFREEIILSTNPPILNIIPAFINHKYTNIVYDIYPEGLVNSGYIKENSIIYKLWLNFNRKAFKNILKVITLTTSMAKLLNKNQTSHEIKVISPWPIKDEVRYEKNTTEFCKKYNLINSFKLIYVGNLGKEYKFDKLLKLAIDLKKHNLIKIIIAGEGYNKNKILELCNKYDLKNVINLTFLNKQEFKEALSEMDVAIVAEAENASFICIPSKFYNLIKYGVPFLNIGKRETELGQIIEINKIGTNIMDEENKEAYNFIIKISSNTSEYKYYCNNVLNLSKQYSRDNIIELVNIIKN